MRVLYLSTLCLSSCAAAAALPYLGSGNNNAQVSTRKHELMLPCAECAFADSGCSRSEQTSSSYLTLKLTTHDNTLFANDQPIFPPPVPMQFHATQYQGADRRYFQHKDVQVAYALEAHPVSPRPGAPLGDIFHLKMDFLDMQGRPATDDLVRIVLLQTATNDLVINDVQHDRKTEIALPARKKAPMSLADIISKMYFKGPDSSSDETATKAANEYPSSSSSSSNSSGFYDHFVHIPRPILLQALLAVFCGILACLAALVIERICLSVRRRFIEHRTLPRPIPVLTIEGEILREEELFSEKKLVQVEVEEVDSMT
ncbi:hypothetical protein P168DRAFT_284586 [Aspergillus campestris IBT 28561]|uniref:Uncharacterized protein n=1 Tax=Aspergillus campestris (strain IBT 28561) TaxID=1392248 RepID=A0A2I1CTS5_ASPC2|nr:uncharacterized protein P168DRAFT_284586 [Aspergillus campestris IBT 28561]PKY01033.1 hypothetical protein P168DRAFT_284586 [Aspergillus campestris IBT 28561]